VRIALPAVLVTLITAAIAALVGVGRADVGTILLLLVLAAVTLPICWRLGTARDPWIWWVATLGFVAKLSGAAVRYWVLVSEYGGIGDATGYHGNGTRLAEVWRTWQIPPLDGRMGEGTQVVRWLTGLLYAPYTPSMLGGFFLFATLAFFGQLLFYSAFRRAVPGARLGPYAAFIFFLPALVFWPSSIGKESLMLLFLGLASYGLARALAAFRPVWLLVAATGLAGAGVVRPHIAALLALSFAIAVLVGRSGWQGATGVRRLMVLAVGIVLVAVSLSSFASRFNLETADDVDPFIGEVQSSTQQGGSEVEGTPIRSPSELPAGVIRVLFRPLPHEAHNLQAMANAIESTALVAIIVWKLPAMIRNARRLRGPYVLMSAAFAAGFTVAFSAVFNLGILARQRSQVFPFLLAVVVALGWRPRHELESAEPAQLRLTGSAASIGVGRTN
jgi:hypothetical protein